VGALAELQNCLETLLAAPPDQKDVQRQQCNSVSNKAKLVVATQIMPGIGVDSVGHINQTVQQLLEAPIAVPVDRGDGAKGLCDTFAGISTKYPFNRNNDQDASIQEFDTFFRPDTGALGKFIQTNQGVLVLQGTQYVPKPGTQVAWGPTFLRFLNGAHFIQQSLYSTGPTGAALLQYRFNVRATLPEGGITGVTFALNGQTLNYPGGSQTTAFIWPGSVPYEGRIGYRAGGAQETDLQSKQGPWAIIKLLALPLPGAKVTPTGSGLSAEWHALQSDGRTPLTLSGSGKPIVVHLDFESGPNPFVLQSGYFENLTCRANR
jgi:type VI protein secretion system component VasK